MRVNANGTTATIAIYDTKIFKSFTDGNAGGETNRRRDEDKMINVLTTTYQRYIFNILIE